MIQITEQQKEIYEDALAEQQTRQGFNYVVEQVLLHKDPEFILGGVGDLWTLEEVKLAKEGGIYCYYKEHKAPKKGFPVDHIVQRVDLIKKMLVVLLDTATKSKVLTAIVCLVFYKQVKSSAITFLEKLNATLNYSLLQPFRYCNCVREVYSAFGDNEALRNIVCSILEFDDAYRYRFQDIVGEMDIFAMREKPYQELTRLLALAEYRETDTRLKSTWSKIAKLLFIAYRVPGVGKMITEFMTRLSPDRIKLDEDDMYYAQKKMGNYKWGSQVS